MGYMKRKLQELNLMDDFLINAVASHPEVGESFCREFLQLLLNKPIGQVRVIAQRTIPAGTPDQHGIRMDVEITEYAASDSNPSDSEVPEYMMPVMHVYDLEPHNYAKSQLLRHNRFYQAKTDSRYMHSRDQNFNHMPNLYVLTFTDYDPFDHDYMLYTVRNRCMEVPDLEYDDGLQFLYFYTKGTKGGSEHLHELLTYMRQSTESNVTNAGIRTIHNYIQRVKIDPETEKGYMRFDDILYYVKKEGRDEGRAEGLSEGRVEGLSAGRTQGHQDAIFDLLADYGDIPQDLHDKICSETNEAVLKTWLKLAAKVSDMNDFISKIS